MTENMNEPKVVETPPSALSATIDALQMTLSFAMQTIVFLAFFAFLFLEWPPSWFKTAVEDHFNVSRYETCVTRSHSARACGELP